jgi:hypothetical protein
MAYRYLIIMTANVMNWGITPFRAAGTSTRPLLFCYVLFPRTLLLCVRPSHGSTANVSIRGKNKMIFVKFMLNVMTLDTCPSPTV